MRYAMQCIFDALCAPHMYVHICIASDLKAGTKAGCAHQFFDRDDKSPLMHYP